MTVAIIGDSWAGKGRLFPEFTDALARYVDRPIVAHALSFSGRRTDEIATYGFATDVENALGGAPQVLLLLTGVNDQIQHGGPKRYAEGLRHLATSWPTAKTFLLSPPSISANFDSRLANARQRLMALTKRDDHASYQSAFAAVQVGHKINFDLFCRGSRWEPSRFEPDGFHLKENEFHELGRFLGSKIGETIRSSSVFQCDDV